MIDKQHELTIEDLRKMTKLKITRFEDDKIQFHFEVRVGNNHGYYRKLEHVYNIKEDRLYWSWNGSPCESSGYHEYVKYSRFFLPFINKVKKIFEENGRG